MEVEIKQALMQLSMLKSSKLWGWRNSSNIDG